MLIFFDLGFNLFSIIPIFWNFSKVQKSHVSAELNEIVQYYHSADHREIWWIGRIGAVE